MIVAASGCTGVLGDFSIGGGSGQHDGAPAMGGDGPAASDASDATTRPTEAGPDAGDATSQADGAADAAADAATMNADAADAAEAAPPPPPVPGKPGVDITAGGNASTSTHFKLVGAVGEGPGGNVIGRSPNFTLKGGVVGGTQ